ncbi:DUF4129 domain-containing protein [Promicromonospora soli]|uniref:Protein-glutamine gamma-glutamyltransferase-like C-terminal domain-containing protein n=1 Tax=Promicromonospora soli TaxID=2035533 RepID=A0A919G3H3_9MICO|nr:DUF4129 domain-containing protein [Promicromonospora soli]GHH77542.1 hypothetical protein GCM10017772_38790 [Promicromonospora soli]
MKATTRLAITCVLVTIVVLGAATATPWTISPPELPEPEFVVPLASPPPVSSSPTPPPEEQQPAQFDTRWAVLVAATLLALLVASLITIAVRRLLEVRRERISTTPDNLAAGTAASTTSDDVDLPELQDAVTRALAHLDGHARPRDAVVAAWVALEEAAARAGTRRDPAQTPTEFAGTVLDATPAPPAAVARLRTLYQRARFTDRPIDADAVAQARTALADIARSLDVPDPGPLIDATGDPTGRRPR